MLLATRPLLRSARHTRPLTTTAAARPDNRAAAVGYAAVFAIPAAMWLAQREPPPLPHDEAASCKALGLMLPSEALSTPVVTVKSFLTEAEVGVLLEAASEAVAKRAVGVVERDAAGAPAGGSDIVWRTAFLHTAGVFARDPRLAPIRAKLRAEMLRQDALHWNVLGSVPDAEINFRTVEAHEYFPGGRLRASNHYDAGSLVTADIMLAAPGTDFDGGRFVTPAAEGPDEGHAFVRGDMVLFVSHKYVLRRCSTTTLLCAPTHPSLTLSPLRYHNVEPVTRGRRRVLVAELWRGPEKTCAHRCLTTGPCGHDLARSQLTSASLQLALMG